MNLLALASGTSEPALFRSTRVTVIGYLAVHLIFRHLKGGVLPAIRAATGFAIATALYFGGLVFIFPSVPVLDSFDRPNSIEDVKDPQKLLRLLQAQHTAIVQSIEIQERAAHCISIAGMVAGFGGLAFLWRMRAVQRDNEYFKERGHQTVENKSETI